MSGIMHVVGNRPQFIKLAPLYHELLKRGYEQYILHSGQHYDENLSDVFFRELKIAEPYSNLNIGSGSHGEMTARALIGIEKEMMDMQPEVVILYGDTDTTLAGALAASKLNVPIAHVEGGIRTYNKTNPEECNRIMTDHMSNIIFCPDDFSVECAEKEGLGNISYKTGDIMYDTFLTVSGEEASDSDKIILMTWHRQENTSSAERMQCILDFVEKLNYKVVCPMHPRTVNCLQKYGLWDRANSIKNFEIIAPVGYVEMINLMNEAKLILTDSGGVSKESSFAGAKCLFFSDLDIWTDLIEAKWICKVDVQSEESVKKALDFAKDAKHVKKEERLSFYGDGTSAKKMVDLLENKLLISRGIK